MTITLLPDLDISLACQVNLNSAAREWLRAHPHSGENPLLIPNTTQTMVDDLHAQHGAGWSYGGYLEDRSTLLQGSYLDQTGGYIHLGVDVNVPAGTRIAAPFDATVINVYNDGDEPQGWGLRIILRPDTPTLSYLVLGHIADASLGVGDCMTSGKEIARVAAPPFNGNWFPHLHIQQIDRQAARHHELDAYRSLDGYGHPRDLGALRKRYPDPTWLVILNS